jgi:7-keto-8-aminopelargonate synthetase-like enzyme
VPVIIGENEAALAASAELLERGFLVPAIRYPTVPKGSARLRVTLSAAHRPDDILSMKSALAARRDCC